MIVVGCVCWRGWALLTDAKHADGACGMSTSNSLLTTVFRHVRHLESSIDSLSLTKKKKSVPSSVVTPYRPCALLDAPGAHTSSIIQLTTHTYTHTHHVVSAACTQHSPSLLSLFPLGSSSSDILLLFLSYLSDRYMLCWRNASLTA